MSSFVCFFNCAIVSFRLCHYCFILHNIQKLFGFCLSTDILHWRSFEKKNEYWKICRFVFEICWHQFYAYSKQRLECSKILLFKYSVFFFIFSRYSLIFQVSLDAAFLVFIFQSSFCGCKKTVQWFVMARRTLSWRTLRIRQPII